MRHLTFSILAAAVSAALFCLVAGCATQPIRSASTLVVAIAPNQAPMCFETKRGPEGLEVDFAKALAAELGKTPLFVNVPRKSLVKAVGEGKADIAMAGLSAAEATSTKVVASQPYLRTGQMALVTEKRYRFKGSFRTLLISAIRIAVVKGSRGHAVAKLTLGESRLKEYTNVEAAVEELKSGRLDMLITDGPVAVRWASRNQDLRACLPLLSDESLCWAIHADNDVLLTQVNACLEGWKQSGKHEAIVEHWIPGHKAYGMDVFESDRPQSYVP